MADESDSSQKMTNPEEPKVGGGDTSRGGWGGWGISPFSVFSDLSKAATIAAEEISRNAVAVAKNAAKTIGDIQNIAPESESSKEEEFEELAPVEEVENGEDKLRKSALDKLEKASYSVNHANMVLFSLKFPFCNHKKERKEPVKLLCRFALTDEKSQSHQGHANIDILDQKLLLGLKVFDSSVENLASGAWQALGSAIKGGSDFVHKLENSAANLAESIQHGGPPVTDGSVAPSLLETGKTFTTMGIQVLERVGKETMDLLIKETGFEVEKNLKISEEQVDEDQLFEEVTFDRCFYIYGGPEQLEKELRCPKDTFAIPSIHVEGELEALSNHYALLFNRRKAKLSSEQKTYYDGKLKQVQQFFSLNFEIDGSGDSDKGKKIESVEDGSGDEMKVLRDSSVTKAAKMASGFTTIVAELAANEVIHRTADRLETIHSEGVHRLSELCCLAVSQLLMLGKSIISNINKAQNEEVVKIDWPEDSAAKAKIIRSKAQSMAGDVEAVSNSFITGISDIVEAYEEAIKVKDADVHNGLPQKSIQEKANAISEHLTADHTTAMDKIQDGLQYLSFVVLSTTP
ncbi:hypothetical protein GIB67_015914 [Kingdonia uniflora]|uniref:DUF7798 domain-containing protein n=1 Tax=Kingdonia uniflora TaxID=39325 RepID=A0A7J7PC91_9MAGN|nr:hypothetical protein GIB67_015914 [Kingdonia uniflora]